MLSLNRIKTIGDTVIGELFLGSEFLCNTLENKQTLIPIGSYKIRNTYSPKFKRDLPILSNEKVSEARGIRVHAGNTKSDTRGCVLVGMELSGDKLLRSKPAVEMVYALVMRNEKLLISE